MLHFSWNLQKKMNIIEDNQQNFFTVKTYDYINQNLRFKTKLFKWAAISSSFYYHFTVPLRYFACNVLNNL